jgi:TPR repeat protein
MPNSFDDYTLDRLWQKAVTAAEEGDNLGVIFLLKSLADKGVWQALARIGELYEAGGGNLEKNLDEAAKWYRKAIFECDDPVAHLGLGRLYYDNALNFEQDRSKAWHHFQKAYINKLPQAGIYLGIMAYFAATTEEDKNKAQEYFKLAADADYFLAYSYLARIEFARGHIFKGMKLAIKSWLLMIRIAKEDPHDPRLLGIERKR